MLVAVLLATWRSAHHHSRHVFPLALIGRNVTEFAARYRGLPRALGPVLTDYPQAALR
jgi:hypothetical protein